MRKIGKWAKMVGFTRVWPVCTLMMLVSPINTAMPSIKSQTRNLKERLSERLVGMSCFIIHYLHLYSMIYYFIKLCPHERRNVFYFISKVNATEVFTSLVFLPCLLLLWCSLHRFQVLRHAWMKKIGTLTILMNLGALTWALIDCVSNLVAFIKAGKMHS